VRAAASLIALLAVASLLGADFGSDARRAFNPKVIATGFESPVHVVASKSEPRKLYVVEQRGTIRVIERGRVSSRYVLDLRNSVSTRDKEQGLLGLAFDPLYAKNRFIYVFYTDDEGDIRLVRYTLRAGRAGSARELFRATKPSSNHNAGNLVVGPGGFLYVGTGDGGSGYDPGGPDPGNNAQNPRSPLGKMFRFNVRKTRPAPVMIALGLRNPWRYSFDRATGDLYIADVGWRSREEVDFVPRARVGRLLNFGWDVFEGTKPLESKDRGPGDLVMPVHEYDHDAGCSITGGFVYRGQSLPAERGRYLFGDYCEGTVWSLRVVDGRAQDVRVEPFEIPSLTTFGEGVAGQLYAASQNGTIYRLDG
jgi:glucose/arabinose dehydrogenase